MTAPETHARLVVLSDTKGPILSFRDNRMELGPGWTPSAAAAEFLAWLNRQLADQEKPA